MAIAKTVDYADWWTEERVQNEILRWELDRFWEVYAKAIITFSAKEGIRFGSLLELGCGRGYVPRELAARRFDFDSYLGVDKCGYLIDQDNHGNTDERINFVRGDLRTFPTNKVDLSFSFAVMKHFLLTDIQEVYAHVLSLGKYGLHAFQISDIDMDDGIEFPHTWFTEETMKTMVEKSGHELLYMQTRWEGTSTRKGKEVFVATRCKGE